MTAAVDTVEVAPMGDPRLDLHLLGRKLEDVYRTAFAEPPWSEEEAAVGRFLARISFHASHRGFRCAVATLGHEVVGFAYGFSGGEAPWSALGHPPVTPGAGLTDRLLAGAFQFAELAVNPEARGRGVGGRLHDLLLDGLPYERSWLVTSPRAEPALTLYLSRGWEPVAELEVPGRLDTRLVLILDPPVRRGTFCGDPAHEQAFFLPPRRQSGRGRTSILPPAGR